MESDGVTAISQYLRERTQREFNIKNHIEVIYNFVNCEMYCRDAGWADRRKEYAPNGERILVHLSNFRPVKRITDTIEIFDRVRKQIPAKLLLIGDGPERSRAEWLATQKGIQDDVLFLGKQDQIREKLGLADIMLLPSELESFGLAALGGDGVRGGADRYPRGRPAGSDRGRKNRLPGGRRRCRNHGALRRRFTQRRQQAESHGKGVSRVGARALQRQQDYSAV